MFVPDEDVTYVIRSGVQALERLELIARLLRPTTIDLLDQVDLGPSASFLDVGCGIGDVAAIMAGRSSGHVLGIDINPGVVEGAAQRAQRLGAGAQYRVAGLQDLGTDDLTGFDAVYARAVLTHLPDPSAALTSMLEATAPGGFVLVEDVDLSALWSAPPCRALDEHRDLYLAAAEAIGASPRAASELGARLAAVGAVDVRVDMVQPVLRAPEDLAVHARTMEAIAEPVVRHGLATMDEVDRIIDELDAWARAEGTVGAMPRIVQVSGRKSG
jgi:ubiquinone/menaquinone biosynthesis C-methylase UbiE